MRVITAIREQACYLYAFNREEVHLPRVPHDTRFPVNVYT